MSTTPDERPAGEAGFIYQLRILASSALAYLRARLQLAGLESKEAAAHYLILLIWLVAGILGFIFGYIFFCIASVFLISHLLRVNWMWILLAAGIAHFVAAGIAIAIAGSKFSRPMFAATITEFKKDQSWLNTPEQTAKPN